VVYGLPHAICTQNLIGLAQRGGPETAPAFYWCCCKQFHLISLHKAMPLHFSSTLPVTTCALTKRFGASLQLGPTVVLMHGRSYVSASTPGISSLTCAA
jgi:hypothetical protein